MKRHTGMKVIFFIVHNKAPSQPQLNILPLEHKRWKKMQWLLKFFLARKLIGLKKMKILGNLFHKENQYGNFFYMVQKWPSIMVIFSLLVLWYSKWMWLQKPMINNSHELFLFCLWVGLVHLVSISSSTSWHYLINIKRFSQPNANKRWIQWHRAEKAELY